MKKWIFGLVLTIGFISASLLPAHAQSLALFGPSQYVRSTASPNFYDETFRACNTGASYNLVVLNGDNGEDVISSATITLNGTELVRANEFNQRVDRIDKAVTLNTENTLTVEVASGPEGFLTVSIECVAGCLGVQITNPVNLSTINKSQAIVEGNLYNTYGETGVTISSGDVDGRVLGLAQVQGISFAGLAPLKTGTNTITATATDACGYKTQDTITINTDSTEEPIRLTALPSSGVPSATTGTMEVAFEAEAFLDNPAASYSWDFNGDGVPDAEGPDLSSATAIFYQGLYFPRVTVTDTGGGVYSETAVVNVLDRAATDTMLKAKWNGLKQALSAGYDDKALIYFADSVKGKYQRVFMDLGPDLVSIIPSLEDMTLISLTGEVAEYITARDQNGTRYVYFIYFMQDFDGIWKIKGM